MKRLFFATVLLCLTITGAFSEVLFSHINMNSENLFLFSAAEFFPGYGDFQTLFTGSADDGDFYPLTFFPEKSWFNRETEKLYVQNRFGLYVSRPGFKGMTPVASFPSFADGEYIKDGKIPPVVLSPDGTKILYVKVLSRVSAGLYLFDIQSGEHFNLETTIDLQYEGEYALWSPDSQMFIYSREEKLYYFSLEQFEENRVLNEPLRVVGEGKLNSISWNEEEESSILYFINKGIVYRLNSSDIFTRSLYSGEFNMSSVTGRVPFDFDSRSDSFTISPDGMRGLVIRKGGDLILYDMNKTDYRADGKRVRSLPYLQLPRSMKVKQILWAESGKLAILASNRNSGESMVFTHDPKGDSPLEFVQTVDRGIVAMSLSPLEDRIVLAGEEGVTLRTFTSWSVLAYRVHSSPVNLFWVDNYSVLVAGARNSLVYNFRDDTSYLSFFSQFDSTGFTKDGRIVLRQDDVKYLYNEYDGTWTSTGRYTTVVDPVTFTEDFRIYSETAPSSLYSNRIMIKEAGSLQSRPLFEAPTAVYDPFPEKEEASDGIVFSHGSRVRAREVALVFNLTNSVEGLPEVLNVLSDYRIRSTFFVNGEFIRRHPDAVVELEKSGHEVGSMFYADFDMTDSRFNIDEDYIRQGLSYNEEEYFSATGRELEPFWHAPYYFENSTIINASAKQSYIYVGRDFDTLDWIPKDGGGVLGNLYLRGSDIIERIMKFKKPGSIIPVTIGKEAYRDDYLFDKLDLLIEALTASGYELVTVSDLIGNSR
ncbi:polysaccharide deacetylase family protein [Spirochaeta isovalerica]|uniref:Peptidoglycan/xylan/chitin deacetylase (PgdA/CDA1 family) n=1 Tax=Spirochaeta isovalerica TaxID=150 RepID=A0A841RD50_9SPIO|nr:polysaccharide deacetylase family protein [Spirochaeta isovalerica]MBB6481576.1 peptidoglycan/xylan/chitin deacetylase (PgdA/CDA1 family) [Spirochaeta isovalerica]